MGLLNFSAKSRLTQEVSPESKNVAENTLSMLQKMQSPEPDLTRKLKKYLLKIKESCNVKEVCPEQRQ